MRKVRFNWADFIIWFVLGLFALIALYPFIYVLAGSFNDGMDYSAGGIWLFPREVTLANYSVVLMDDDPAKIPLAMGIARRTLQVVRQNIVFALAVKFLCLALGALGVANMWWAIFADVGVMVLCVLNATRTLYTRTLR